MAAFESLAAEFSPQIRRFARGFVDSEADDVAQEALIKAFRTVRSYRFDASFRTWLFRIVRNACIDAVRRRKSHRRKQHALGEEVGVANASGGPRPDRELLERERHEQLWRLIRALPHRFRTPLILCDIEGLSYQEAAAIERIPVGTVRSRLARARRKLREELAQAGESNDE